MSYPSNSNLPKPPPKAPPPPRAPAAAPPAAPPRAAVAPTRVPFTAAAAVAAAPAMPVAPTATITPGTAAGARPRGEAAATPTPTVDARGLPANLAPMVEAITVYDQLLSEENALLTAGDAKGVSALVDRKMAATRLYQERLHAVLSDRECTRSLTPEQRASVIALVKCLEKRAQENTTLLKANMNAIEQVFEAINEAARKMRRQEVAYSKAGMIQESYGRGGVSWAHNSMI
jgi:hypothetical protein